MVGCVATERGAATSGTPRDKGTEKTAGEGDEGERQGQPLPVSHCRKCRFQLSSLAFCFSSINFPLVPCLRHCSQCLGNLSFIYKVASSHCACWTVSSPLSLSAPPIDWVNHSSPETNPSWTQKLIFILHQFLVLGTLSHHPLSALHPTEDPTTAYNCTRHWRPPFCPTHSTTSSGQPSTLTPPTQSMEEFTSSKEEQCHSGGVW